MKILLIPRVGEDVRKTGVLKSIGGEQIGIITLKMLLTAYIKCPGSSTSNLPPRRYNQA